MKQEQAFKALQSLKKAKLNLSWNDRIPEPLEWNQIKLKFPKKGQNNQILTEYKKSVTKLNLQQNFNSDNLKGQ